MFLIGQKKFLLFVKLKIHFHGLMLLMSEMVKRLLGHFMKKNCKRLIKKSLEQKKYLKEKGDKWYVKWKGYHNSFNSWINKKDHV